MWTAIPLSQLGTWDGKCIYMIKDENRRCKSSAGGDTNKHRFGNRNELIAKISQGVSLTRQEKSELARGLCCLRWHSTEDIAREICEVWARVPATVLVPLPPQQNEVQTLEAENEMLATRQAEEVSKDGNELLKGTLGVPGITAETSVRVTPVRHTTRSETESPANTKMINSDSLEVPGQLSHASTPDRRFSANKAYSASPTGFLGACSSDTLLQVETCHKDVDLATPDLSSLTLFSAVTTKFEVARSPVIGAFYSYKLAPYSCNITPTLISAALESFSMRDLREIGPLEVSSLPVGGLLKKLLKSFLRVFVSFCWAGNMSFVQFTGSVVWTSVLVWTQVERRILQEILHKNYILEDVDDE